MNAEPGEEIVREGCPAHHFYVVCTGGVEIRKGDRSLALLGEGSAFGEIALLTGEARTATVRAVARSELLAIDRSDFQDLIEVHPASIPAFSEAIALRILGAAFPEPRIS